MQYTLDHIERYAPRACVTLDHPPPHLTTLRPSGVSVELVGGSAGHGERLYQEAHGRALLVVQFELHEGGHRVQP